MVSMFWLWGDYKDNIEKLTAGMLPASDLRFSNRNVELNGSGGRRFPFRRC
jgi:hypothetical protein